MAEALYQREIVELHAFFVEWFSSHLTQTEADFARFSQVMADEMHFITPDGQVQNRQQLLAGLWQAHGSQAQGKSPGRIWIENVTLRYAFGHQALLTYEEWQEVGDKTTARYSSVLFGSKLQTPNGLEWLHVHETWLSR